MSSRAMRLRSRCGVAGSDHRAGKSAASARMRSCVLVGERGGRWRRWPCRSRPGRLQLAEGVVPVGFEAVGDEPVVGVDGEVAAAGQVGVVAGAFDVAAAQRVGFVGAGFEFGLHGEGDLEGERGDGVEQQLADGGVDAGAGDGLAARAAPSGSHSRMQW